ncbi:MAG: WYL domain-containing protein [Bacteroidales bacterium]|nr:WYL domain-containing protein [Bacteroidales bacterium]
MPDNKHALLRYETIDRCLGNTRKVYHAQELLEACNDAIYECFGEGGIQRRQLYDDLNYLEDHYNAPILRERDGQRIIIRYSDPNFSIRNRTLSQNELAKLKDAISFLSQFAGEPFEWIQDIAEKLSSEFQDNENIKSIVSFQQNQNVLGMKYFLQILNAISAKKPIEFRYKPYNLDELVITMSPHFLKQYNHRWYVFGYVENLNYIPNYALDRIKGKIKLSKQPFVESGIDYQEGFFDDIVGVTHYKDGVLEKIVLQVDDDYIGYFESNPIHDTLKPVTGKPGYYSMKVIFNKELATAIFSHLDKIRLVSDETGLLRAELNRRLKTAVEKMEASNADS